jgi:N-acetylneuraminate epimerase
MLEAKRKIAAIVACCLLTVLPQCQPNFNHSTNKEMLMSPEPIMQQTTEWQLYGKLPPQENNKPSIGISAAFTAILGDYLLVAGGANFPNGHPFFDKGIKAYYDDLWLFDTKASQLETAYHIRLPYPVAHGALIRNETGLLLIGGQNGSGPIKSILQVTLQDNQPQVSLWSELPFSWHSGAAVWYQGALYLFGGERDGVATAGVCRFDPNTLACTELPPIPGPPRQQFPAQLLGDTVYVFGGIDAQGTPDNFTRTDVHALNLPNQTWTQMANTHYQQQAFSVSGGAAVALNEQKILLLGGVNRAVFNETLFQFSRLKDDELQQYKTYYFGLTAEQINFSRQQLIFDVTTNTWDALPTPVPFIGGAGPLTLANNKQHIYWVGGEIQPGVRSPFVYRRQFLFNNQPSSTHQ